MDGTPTTVETLERGSNVKLEIGKSKAKTGLTDESKLAHLLSLVVSGVIVVFLSAVLADGASVITLKSAEHLPRLTELCKDMLDIKRVHSGDDMYYDVYPHGARELSLPEYVADNQVYFGEE